MVSCRRLALLYFFLLAAAAQGQEAPKSAFLDQVRSHFSTWDTDRDNSLSPAEIELAVANPR